MKRIVVVCEDAGGARALGPVITCLIERGDEIDLVLGRVASEVLRADGVADVATVTDTTSAQQAIHRALSSRPAAVLTTSTCWGLRLEARATQMARRQGVPTLTLIDFPSQLTVRLSFPGTDDLGALGDQILAMDREMARRLVAAGVPEHRISVTGNPAFDALWREHEYPPLRPEQAYVLFLSQPIAALHGSDESIPTFLGYTEAIVLEAVARLVAPHGIELRVRPHPREDGAALAAFAEQLPGRVRLDTAATLRDAVEQARWVVGMTSIALIEAALLGKTAISVQFERRGEDPLWTNALGLTVAVTSRDELRDAVAAALDAPPQPARTRSLMAKLGWSPDAARRVLACVDAAAMRTPTRVA